MKPTAFITGITGQDGSYLAELLLKKKYRVIGLVSHRYNIGYSNIDAIKDKIILETGDLLDRGGLEKIITRHRPDEIYNLGGLTFAPDSWDKPGLTLDINTLGLVRILEIIKEKLPKTKLYQATSAKIFALAKESPQTESTPVSPNNPYEISKACSHYLIQGFRRQFNLFLVSGILYNHESERRGPEFVTRKISLNAAKIKLGLVKKLPLGNLEAKQDWGYAPDYVEAMWLMLQQPQPDDYVIATGKLHTVRDICRIAFSHLGLDYQKFVTVDKRFFRKIEAEAPTGNSAKAQKLLGWQPKVSFEQMIIKMVEHDLKLLKAGEEL
jgi:GDPmannose 4,6-dehydratase